MKEQTRFYEELSMNSHPSLQTHYYDGWILRVSNGYTNRANSVNMIYPSTIDPITKIEFCEEYYQKCRQSSVFKVTDGSDKTIDPLLANRGYQIVTPTRLMCMDLANREFASEASKNCIITKYADEEWWNAYFVLEHCNDLKTQATAKQMMDMVQNITLYCRMVENGKSIACASAVIERGHMALAHVVVEETYRRQGYGRRLCETLLCEAKKQGAHSAYLQVVESNLAANHLYEKLGYRKLYSYWYRVKK